MTLANAVAFASVICQMGGGRMDLYANSRGDTLQMTRSHLVSCATARAKRFQS